VVALRNRHREERSNVVIQTPLIEGLDGRAGFVEASAH
jgi:hypothetical protein